MMIKAIKITLILVSIISTNTFAQVFPLPGKSTDNFSSI